MRCVALYAIGAMADTVWVPPTFEPYFGDRLKEELARSRPTDDQLASGTPWVTGLCMAFSFDPSREHRWGVMEWETERALRQLPLRARWRINSDTQERQTNLLLPLAVRALQDALVDAELISLNVDHIVRVDDKANTDRTVVHLTNGESIPVEGKDRTRLWDILSQSTLLPADKNLL